MKNLAAILALFALPFLALAGASGGYPPWVYTGTPSAGQFWTYNSGGYWSNSSFAPGNTSAYGSPTAGQVAVWHDSNSIGGSNTTGTGNVVFDTSPTLHGTVLSGATTLGNVTTDSINSGRALKSVVSTPLLIGGYNTPGTYQGATLNGNGTVTTQTIAGQFGQTIFEQDWPIMTTPGNVTTSTNPDATWAIGYNGAGTGVGVSGNDLTSTLNIERWYDARSPGGATPGALQCVNEVYWNFSYNRTTERPWYYQFSLGTAAGDANPVGHSIFAAIADSYSIGPSINMPNHAATVFSINYDPTTPLLTWGYDANLGGNVAVSGTLTAAATVRSASGNSLTLLGGTGGHKVVAGNPAQGVPSIALTTVNTGMAAWGLNGASVQYGGSGIVYTNTSTAAGLDTGNRTVVGSAAFHYFSAPTLAATNAFIKTTDAMTIYAEAPTAGTNMQITHPWVFYTTGDFRVGRITTGGAFLAGAVNIANQNSLTFTNLAGTFAEANASVSSTDALNITMSSQNAPSSGVVAGDITIDSAHLQLNVGTNNPIKTGTGTFTCGGALTAATLTLSGTAVTTEVAVASVHTISIVAGGTTYRVMTSN